MALTGKQNRFVEEYLIDHNATAAAKRAGYSKKTAGSQGQRLLTNVEIKKKIQQANQKRSERTEITQDRVLEEIGKYAFAEASDSSDSELKHSSKTKYLDMACKCLGMYDSKNIGPDISEEDDPLTKALKEEAEKMNDADQ